MNIDLVTTPGTLFLALLGGILPTTFWLWFWLKEDKLHPEPRGLLILSFVAGMLATIIAFPIEKYLAEQLFSGQAQSSLSLLFSWAVVEEILKLIAIYLVALRTKYFDEPIDAVIYLVTVALGFAALENTIFLFSPLQTGDTFATIALSNFRFIGATLLHVATSGMVGIALALTFYQGKALRGLALLSALVLACVLHTIFNFSIIASEGGLLYEVFIVLWFFIIGILLWCEKIKRMAPRSHIEYPRTGIDTTTVS